MERWLLRLHGLQRMSDGVGDLFVRSCGLPLVILHHAGSWPAQRGNSLIALAGWVVPWPAWLLVRLVIGPLVAVTSRRE
jgi:hypothetical protein